MALEIPKRIKKQFMENRGTYEDIEVVDRPYRLVTEFNELRGEVQTRKVPLLDHEILEAGGIKRFFNDDGSRRDGSWPYDPDVKPAPKKKRKKKSSK